MVLAELVAFDAESDYEYGFAPILERHKRHKTGQISKKER